MESRARVITAPRVRRSPLNLVLTLLVIAGLFSSFAQLQSVSAQTVTNSLADAVPADTPVFMQADLDQDSAQWKQTYELLDRAGITKMLEQQNGPTAHQISEMIKGAHLSGPMAIAFTDADALTAASMTQGANTINTTAVDTSTAGTAPTIPTGMVVLFRGDDAEGQYTFLRKIVTDEAQKNNTTVKTTDYNGVTIEFWESTDPAKMPTAIANVNGTTVLSVTPKDIEPVVDTLAGKNESLASNADFTKVSGAFTTESMMFGFANGAAMTEAYVKADPQVAKALSGMPDANGGYSGFNVYASENGFHFDTVAYAAPGKNGAVASPAASPSTGTPTMASKVPADALLFVNGFDLSKSGISEMLGFFLQGAFSANASMAPGATPSASPVSTPTVDDAYAMIEQQIGFNPKTDLLDHLNGEWMMYGSVADLNSPDSLSVAFVSGTSDEATVTETTDKISELLNAQLPAGSELSTRDVNGSKVNVVTVKDGMAEGVDLVIEYGVVNGEFVIGINKGLDNYLNTPSSTLADDPIFKQTFDALPKDNITGQAYVNLDRLIPLVLQASASSSTGPQVAEAKDADPTCKEYADQTAAQDAYDKDPSENWAMDQDFDGKACEDFWTAAATPAMASASPVAQNPLNILSIGSVSYTDGDMMRTSAILLIGK